MGSLHNDLASWASKSNAQGQDRIEITNETALKIADQIVEMATRIEELEYHVRNPRHPAYKDLTDYQYGLNPWRRFRPYKPDQIRIERGEDYRAGTHTICDHCGCEYADHEPVVGYEFLNRLCNGNLVKL
ncbi:hypothetical protein EVB64_093 [Rhizobium phage RHph_TM61]|nr:hypothetical protein EVB61_091 [Rhizobium phage RHph_TM21B]QIG77680.1 hypothetical protein EVB64_093 [Rhizobium phage RHph_TM61]